MQAVADEAHLAAMNEETRGAAIQRRLEELGLSDREWHRETGIDRKTLNRAIAGESSVRASTYGAIESALDKLERRVRGGDIKPEGDLVTFRLSGNFGVEVTVQGPVANVEELEAAVERLLRKMGEETPK